MKVTKKSLTVAALLAATCLFGGCGKANIAYIDGARVMKESPQLQAIVNEGNEKLTAQEKESSAKLAQDKAGKSEEEFQKEEQEERAKMMDLQQQYSQQLKTKIDTVVGEIARTKKLDVVMANEGVDKTVVEGGVDITDEVIQKLQ